MAILRNLVKLSCVCLLTASAAWAQAAQWVSTSGITSINGDEVTLTGSAVRARTDILNIPVVVGQTYTLTGLAKNSVAGAWTYIGVVNNGVATEHGHNLANYTAVSPITFTAQASTVSVYASFWQGQTGSGYVKGVALNGTALIAPATTGGSSPCTGTYLLCDDFNGSSIDTSLWTIGNVDIAHKYPVRPENVSLGNYNDNGVNIKVVDTTIYGDQHAGPKRQGGLLITKQLFGGARYEVRMKPLPGPNGCSCMWNYYDSLNEASPPATRIYTEIDIEMPAHFSSPPAWTNWQRTLGFNTWSHTDADADATYINYQSPTVNPFDGQFHVFRWDWYDGSNGTPRIDWYVDGIYQATTSQHVSDHPAQLWVGNWPAPWPGMTYNFDTLHLYIDWVKITALK